MVVFVTGRCRMIERAIRTLTVGITESRTLVVRHSKMGKIERITDEPQRDDRKPVEIRPPLEEHELKSESPPGFGLRMPGVVPPLGLGISMSGEIPWKLN